MNKMYAPPMMEFNQFREKWPADIGWKVNGMCTIESFQIMNIRAEEPYQRFVPAAGGQDSYYEEVTLDSVAQECFGKTFMEWVAPHEDMLTPAMERIQNRIDFGHELVNKFNVENSAIWEMQQTPPATAVAQVQEIIVTLRDSVLLPLTSGALETAMVSLQTMSPFAIVTQDRLTAYAMEIQEYLQNESN